MEVDGEGSGDWKTQSGSNKKRKNKRSNSDSREPEDGNKEIEPKQQRVESSHENRVILKLQDGQTRFNSFNPIRLAEILKKELGGVVNAQILADGKLLIECSSAMQKAKAEKLTLIGGKKVESVVLGKRNGLKGVVYGVSLEMEMSDLLKEVQGAKVVEATRIRSFRDGVKSDSTTVVLTFQGENLPEKIFLGCLAFRVQPYRRPPLRCFKCQRYGHIAAVCRGTRRCGKCGEDHVFAECRVEMLKCGTCGGGHVAGSRQCEQYKHAVKVQEYREANKGISYAEAVKQISSSNRMETGGENRREEELRSSKTETLVDEPVLGNKVNFLAFIIQVLSGLKNTKNNSDIVKIVVEAAESNLGISDVVPEALHSMVFSREKLNSGCSSSRSDGQ